MASRNLPVAARIATGASSEIVDISLRDVNETIGDGGTDSYRLPEGA